MVAPGLNYLWCHNSGWEQKRTILPPRSDSLGRAVAPEPRTPVTPHRTLLCHVETQLCYCSFGVFFGHLSFFYTTCNPLLCFFFILSASLYSQVLLRSCHCSTESCLAPTIWKKRKKSKKKKKNGNLFKTDKGRDKREMPCTIFFCGCCVHVSPPITNVTFQLH